MQIGDVPVTVPAFAFGLTVKALNEDTGLPQPLLTVYVISVAPAATAVTNPVDALTVATEVLVLLHAPPAVPLLVKVVVAPMQIGVVPLTMPAVTFGETVNVLNDDTGLPQPLLTVYVISVAPAATAVTNPVDALTVATEVLVLLHAPPAVPLLVKVVVAPMQIGVVPLTMPAVTFGETVNVLNDDTGLPQPLLTVYVISVAPAATAVTNPVDALTVATEVLVLLHAPPAVPLLVKVVVAPMQIGVVPLTVPAVTFGETVNVLNADTGLPQPLLTVYVISVVPAATAVTSPVDAFTVATEVLVLLHAPPAVPLLVKVVVPPMQIGVVPVTVPAVTFGETVNVLNADTGLPQPLLTVYVMSAVPAATAVTNPVDALTVATEVLVLLHEPPAVPLLV